MNIDNEQFDAIRDKMSGVNFEFQHENLKLKAAEAADGDAMSKHYEQSQLSGTGFVSSIEDDPQALTPVLTVP